jgi:hypothetical protein
MTIHSSTQRYSSTENILIGSCCPPSLLTAVAGVHQNPLSLEFPRFTFVQLCRCLMASFHSNDAEAGPVVFQVITPSRIVEFLLCHTVALSPILKQKSEIPNQDAVENHFVILGFDKFDEMVFLKFLRSILGNLILLTIIRSFWFVRSFQSASGKHFLCLLRSFGLAWPPISCRLSRRCLFKCSFLW